MKPGELAATAGTLPRLTEAMAERYGDRPALGTATGSDGVGLTYSELSRAARAGGAVLTALELSPGTRVVLKLSNSPSWVAAFFAVLRAGHVAVPVPVETPQEHLLALLGHVGAEVMITEGTPPACGVRCVDVVTLFGLSDLPIPDPACAPADTAVLAFTSGSTGTPRAVELSHENLLSDLRAVLEVDQTGPDDVFLSVLPLAHLYELMVGLLAPLTCGATILYAGLPLPHRIVGMLKDHGVTHTLAVPALLDALYADLLDTLVEEGLVDRDRRKQPLEETARRFRDGATDLDLPTLCAAVRRRIGERLRFVGSGGAALSSAWDDILPALGITLEYGYGLTEAGPVVCMGKCGEVPGGSVGPPLPGVEVQIGENGEVLVRGPNVMKGYYGDTRATAEALTGGWLHTGDLGSLDADGNLFINGRRKEAIVTASGTCIDPCEFERHYQSDLFRELCVTAIPDEQGNDLPTLVVVPSAPDLRAASLEAELAALRAKAPAHLRVTRLALLGQPLPRTATGKIRRRHVAGLLNNQNDRGASA